MGGYHPPAPLEAYYELGAQLARRGVHLVTGGGGSMAGGPVTSLLAGFTSVTERQGRTIGIVPDRSLGVDEGVNPLNDTLVYTNLPAGHAKPNSRNHLNVLLADAVVALAGGPGTLNEIELAVRYGRALVADIYWQQLATVPDAAPAVPADGSFGFLFVIPKFWEAASDGGRALTAEGRAMRDRIGRTLFGLAESSFFRPMEALPSCVYRTNRAEVSAPPEKRRKP